MDLFHFKQFAVAHHRSAMKIGTDAVLLGAWVDIETTTQRILDVGTGCGIIALMLAQRSSALIDAIDIDPESVSEASENFRHSPWPNQLRALDISLQDFSYKSTEKYDMIVCNPPFFQNSLKPKNPKLKLAKHNHQLDFRTFWECISGLITANGTVGVILPVNEADYFENLGFEMNLYLVKKCSVIPITGKKANRKLLLFSPIEPDNMVSEEIILRQQSGSFSRAYRELTREYHPEEYFKNNF
ncbi:MAG: methyltransferase domain-containing protein [Sphingobacteriia bacterium]|nr:methyltransferase domain-containing protein [Sphingobacteriia bacterium]